MSQDPRRPTTDEVRHECIAGRRANVITLIYPNRFLIKNYDKHKVIKRQENQDVGAELVSKLSKLPTQYSSDHITNEYCQTMQTMIDKLVERSSSPTDLKIIETIVKDEKCNEQEEKDGKEKQKFSPLNSSFGPLVKIK